MTWIKGQIYHALALMNHLEIFYPIRFHHPSYVKPLNYNIFIKQVNYIKLKAFHALTYQLTSISQSSYGSKIWPLSLIGPCINKVLTSIYQVDWDPKVESDPRYWDAFQRLNLDILYAPTDYWDDAGDDNLNHSFKGINQFNQRPQLQTHLTHPIWNQFLKAALFLWNYSWRNIICHVWSKRLLVGIQDNNIQKKHHI